MASSISLRLLLGLLRSASSRLLNWSTNALESENPLTFEATGLTVIYGDNGSGKSGYSRLLKPIARAREREEILSDVFRDTALVKPSAVLTVRVGEVEKPIFWPESNPPELKRMLFYDRSCGAAYVATESDFPYRPSALFVMDGLIQACVAIRDLLDARLESNAKSASVLPAVDEEIRDTEIGKFLRNLTGHSLASVLDDLVKRNSAAESLVELKGEEVVLRGSDTTNERQRLTRYAARLDSLRKHVLDLEEALGDEALTRIQTDRNQLTALETTAGILAGTFKSEPLSGVGASAWKELWESARRFSQTEAYSNRTFPVVTENARCVLCQQPLEEETRERLSRFERFVQDDTQTHLRDARASWATQIASLTNLRTTSESIDTYLTDLSAEERDLAPEIRGLIASFETARVSVVEALQGSADLPVPPLQVNEITSRLEAAAEASRIKARDLSDPEAIKQRLKAVSYRRKELELIKAVEDRREFVTNEIRRLKERETLEAVKNTAATGPITMQVLKLAEESITEVIRNTFVRETDRMHLERVTIAKTRGDKGNLLHQPKLVGARQSAMLPRVFSEGELTALGLAAFFTEAHLDESKSALILDDPVTSLDHVRRGRVAARLAELAGTRQVIVFTHDTQFVLDLRRETQGLGIPLAERSVARGRKGERKPGACGNNLPWKTKDVSGRLGDLRAELAVIKRESENWDGETYEKEVASWAGRLSETWERIFSQELVGQVLAEGGSEVRPAMVKVLARFSQADDQQFQASYRRVSQWAPRHDKSAMTNYVAPEVFSLEQELLLVDNWFKRVKEYKN